MTVEAFRAALEEEVSVCAEFGVPMALISAEGAWREEAVRRALDSLRAGDLITQPGPGEILIVLPNTGAATARVVEERLKKAAPGATLGVATYARGDAAEELLQRARAARQELPQPGSP